MKYPFDLDDDIIEFDTADPFNPENTLRGYVNRTQGQLYGCLYITHINGKPCPQVIYSCPKLHYPFDKNGENWKFPDFDDTEVYEKLDGCFSYQMLVCTDKGRISIGQLVNSTDWKDRRVKAYNFDTESIVYTKILSVNKQRRKNEMLRILFQKRGMHRSKPYIIYCTHNHKFWSDNSWVEAKNLNVNDSVAINSVYTERIALEMLTGCILGDSYIYYGKDKEHNKCGFPSLQFIHSTKQKEYALLKYKLLKNICRSEPKEYTCKGAYTEEKIRFSTKSSAVFDEISNLLTIKNGKRHISEKIEKYLSPTALAFWYMDDGSILYNVNPRIVLHTEGVHKQSVLLLKNILDKKYSFNCRVADYGKGYVIELNVEDTESFLNMIFPFIAKSMQYKLPEHLRISNPVVYQTQPFNIYDCLSPSKVISIEHYTPKKYYVYDIQTETQNYFIYDILVHNSCIIGYKYHDVNKNEFLTYKTRLRPFIGSSKFGNFFSMWNEMLEKYPEINKLCQAYDYNFIFELYGKRNKILIDYDVPLDTKLIFAVHRLTGAIIPPTTVQKFNTYDIPTVQKANSLGEWQDCTTDAKKELYISIQDKLESDLYIDEENHIMVGKEGYVIYFLKDGNAVQIKNKPLSVLKYHWSGGAIAYESIYTTIINAFENFDEPKYIDVVQLLKEEFDVDKIEKSCRRIEKILVRVTIDKKFQYELSIHYKKLNVDINEDKITVMRHFATLYPKSEAKRIFNLLTQYEESK